MSPESPGTPVPDFRPGATRLPARGPKVLLFVLLGVFAGGAVLTAVAGFGFYFLFKRGQNLPVTDADRAVVVSFDDLSQYFEIEKREPQEKFTKATFPKAALEYTFNQPGLMIRSSAGIESSALAARATTFGFEATFGAALGELEAMDLKVPGMDQSSAYLIRKKDNPIGNLFFARKGERTFMLVTVGAWFSDPATLASVVEPRLEALQTWKP
jgi:hypothetical protein